ncbi:MAG TPA: peptidoglycan editing factor PgeF [Steroidobacteraceae bacterium]|nr:peptidoglycan editing factor PgeF [Steroidobacteraceae bacterium]
MSVEVLVPEWPAPPGVRALATGRAGGVSVGRYASLNLAAHVGDAPAAVSENRARLRTAAALPAEPGWLEQVHGTRVLDLDAWGAGGAGPADAAITRQMGRVCAILSADCLPVLLAARSGTAVGAAHAGWRGLAAGVIEATVRALAVPPASLIAWLGPAISPEHFEVGPEVRAAFLAVDPEAATAFVENARGRYQADLYRLARLRLERAGVSAVFGVQACTFADANRYFSHRREGPTGRQATLIWREPAP